MKECSGASNNSWQALELKHKEIIRLYVTRGSKIINVEIEKRTIFKFHLIEKRIIIIN